MNVKHWVAVAVVAFGMGAAVFVPLASAQEVSPEQLALARKYIDLTDKASVYETALLRVAVDTLKVLGPQNPEVEGPIKDAITRTLDFYKPKKDDLLNEFARVYATKFTADELQQMVDFYSSPAGVKLATSTLDVNQGIKAVMQVFSANLNRDFLAKVRADLKANGVKM